MVTRYRFAVLAPAKPTDTVRGFRKLESDPYRYRQMLNGMQLLRGKTYREDGAISAAELDARGGFAMDDDELCWHLLLLDEVGDTVVGCVRLRVHPNTVTFDGLRVKHAARANHGMMASRIRTAIEADLKLAREHGLLYTEIGGWALAKQWRGTKAALDILAGSYALGEIWGGSLGVATATFRHGSASILKKMGAQSFIVNGEQLPPYEDPQYGCTMELLRFTRTPAQRFCLLVDPLKKQLASLPAIAAPSTFVMRPAPVFSQVQVA